MTKLILVRHGSTEWNEKKLMQGKTDIPLSQEGKKQAIKLRKRFQDEQLDVIYSSELRRAKQTAKEVAKEHEIKVIEHPFLNEVSYGAWEGITYEEVKKRFPEEVTRRGKDKFSYAPPKGGESPKSLQKRLINFMKEIVKKYGGQTILVVCHNGVKRMLLGTLLGWSEKKIMETRLNNTSVSILHVEKSRSKMELFNCTKHLEL